MSLKSVAKAVAPPVVWDLLSTMKNGRLPAPSTFQGVTTTHSMRNLREGPFGAAFDAYGGLDPHVSPEVLRLRVYNVAMLARRATEVPGDFVTCGVSWGVAPRVMFEFIGKRRLHLVDKFTGVHEQGTHAEYNTDATLVRRQYPEAALVTMHEAHIPEAFPLHGCERIALAHLNTGVVPAETASLPYLYEQLSPGGVIIIDKYCFGTGHERVYDAVAESLGTWIETLVTGQGVLAKPRTA